MINPYESPRNIGLWAPPQEESEFIRRHRIWLIVANAYPWAILIIFKLFGSQTLFDMYVLIWLVVCAFWWGSFQALNRGESKQMLFATRWFILAAINFCMAIFTWEVMEPEPRNVPGAPGGKLLEIIFTMTKYAIPRAFKSAICFGVVFLLTVFLRYRWRLIPVYQLHHQQAPSKRFSLYPVVGLTLLVVVSFFLNWIEQPFEMKWYLTPWSLLAISSLFVLWHELLQPRLRMIPLIVIAIFFIGSQQFARQDFLYFFRMQRSAPESDFVKLMQRPQFLVVFDLIVFSMGIGGRWVGWRIVPRLIEKPVEIEQAGLTQLTN